MVNGIYLGIVSTILGTYVGFKYSAKYKNRRKFLADWYTFNTALKCELSFGKNSLKSLIEKREGRFIEILKTCVLDGENPKIKELQKSEEEFFYTYANSLGQSDGKSQSEYISGVNEKVKSMLSDAEKNEKQRAPLCIKLGFICGLAVLVLVI